MSTMSLRLPDSLHERARQIAKREGVSINQLVATALAEKLSALDTPEYFEARAVWDERPRRLQWLIHLVEREAKNSRSKRDFHAGRGSPRADSAEAKAEALEWVLQLLLQVRDAAQSVDEESSIPRFDPEQDSIPGWDPEMEGAICRFDLAFVERTGEHSLFLKALSDLWTVALYGLLSAAGRSTGLDGPVLYASEDSVDALRALYAKDETLQNALFQEPFGFGEPGAIERAFAQVFGVSVYPQWREAFEREQYDLCAILTETSDPE